MMQNLKDARCDILANNGEKGVFILTLRSMLRRICPYIYGCPRIEPRGCYDATVREAVKAFQRFADLPETGIVDYITWERLYDTAKAIKKGYFFDYPGFDLRLGYMGRDVKRLKNMLFKIKKVVPSIRISSMSEIFDTETELSLIRAQRAFGMIPDGKASKQCWEKLVSVISV